MQEVQKEYRERGIGHKKRGDLKGGWTGERFFFMRRQGKEECEMSFASANLHKLLSPRSPSAFSPLSLSPLPSPLSPSLLSPLSTLPYHLQNPLVSSLQRIRAARKCYKVYFKSSLLVSKQLDGPYVSKILFTVIVSSRKLFHFLPVVKLSS